MMERKKAMSPNENQTAEGAQLARKEAEIDQTRSAIKEDLQTLGQRLSPEHLKEDAKEVMAEAKNKAVETLHEAKDVATATFREVKDSAMDTVNAKVGEFKDNVRRVEHDAVSYLRDNAVPLALIGIGAYWLVSSRRRREQRWEGEYRAFDDYPQYGERYSTSERMRDSAERKYYRAREGARELGSQASHRAQEWKEGAENKVNEIAGRVRDTAEHELEHVRHAYHDAGHKVSEAASRARDFAGREMRQAREYSMRATEEHPLAVGAVALTAGIGLGLLLPQTRRESELLGTKRDRLIDEAKGMAQDWGNTVKETARDMKDSLTGASSH